MWQNQWYNNYTNYDNCGHGNDDNSFPNTKYSNLYERISLRQES